MAKKKQQDAEETEGTDEEGSGAKGSKGKGSKKSLLPAIIIAVGLIGAAFVFKSCGSSGGGEEAHGEAGAETTTTLPADTPRAEIPFEPITINVSDGKYLKVGMALSVMEGASYGEAHGAEAPAPTIPASAGGEGAGEALAVIAEELMPEVNDLVISTLGGANAAVLTTPDGREQARAQLAALLSEHLHADVKLYFTSYVVA